MDGTTTFEDLVDLMDRLREPGGCPWDREQTYETLRAFLLEECYEVLDALDRGDRAALRDELGDLLFQVVFLSRLAQEEGRFTARDVVRGIAQKMVRRHPHVFGGATAETSDEVLRNWEEIKRREREAAPSRPGPRSLLEGVPRALPALARAAQLGSRAARVGFDWRNASEVLDKVHEELAELRAAVARGDRAEIGEEVGDLLFTVAMLARHLGADPEAALDRTSRKFQSRFTRLEEEARRRGISLPDAGMEILDRLWEESKGAEEG